jgi:branched-subunit amino acid aminotransferase/4-amino-4-deoxychorismate lyase
VVADTLCAPDNSVPWLHSITRDEVFSVAAGMGFKTRVERAKPSDLVGLEIWALSSLHGIRPVVDWVNLGSPVGPIRHAEAFQKRLRMLSAQIA